MVPPFFIVGAQRSGSTLLRLILNASSKIAIPEEARFLTPLLKRKYLYEPFEGKRLQSLIAYISSVPHLKTWNYDYAPFLEEVSKRTKITLHDFIEGLYSSYSISEGKQFWGDKSLFFNWIDILHTLFPEARFLHIVRDGRDVFDSQRRLNPSRDNVAVAAVEWRFKILKIERSFAKLPRGAHMTIRYEDLLRIPEKTIRDVCSFVGISYEPEMLDFYKTSKYYIGDHHSTLIFGPIRSDNCYKWRKNLSEIEINIFNLLAQGTLSKYGYQSVVQYKFPYIFRTVLHLAKGLLIRGWEVFKTRRILNEAIELGERFDQKKFDAIPVGKQPEKKL